MTEVNNAAPLAGNEALDILLARGRQLSEQLTGPDASYGARLPDDVLQLLEAHEAVVLTEGAAVVRGYVRASLLDGNMQPRKPESFNRRDRVEVGARLAGLVEATHISVISVQVLAEGIAAPAEQPAPSPTAKTATDSPIPTLPTTANT